MILGTDVVSEGSIEGDIGTVGSDELGSQDGDISTVGSDELGSLEGDISTVGSDETDGSIVGSLEGSREIEGSIVDGAVVGLHVNIRVGLLDLGAGAFESLLVGVFEGGTFGELDGLILGTEDDEMILSGTEVGEAEGTMEILAVGLADGVFDGIIEGA